MRRLHSMVWMLGSAAAALCAALTVTLADAGERSRRRVPVRWSADEKAVLASLQPEAAAAGAGGPVERGGAAARRRRSGPAPLQRHPPQPQRRRLVRQLPRPGQAVPGRPAGEPGRGHRLAPRDAHRRRGPRPLAVLGRPQGQPVGAGARPARGCGGAWDQPHAGGASGAPRTTVATTRRSSARCRGSTDCRTTPAPRATRPSRRRGRRSTRAAARRCRGCSRTSARPSRRTRSRCSTGRLGWTATSTRCCAATPQPGGLLRADEVRGLRLFIGKAQCVSCHNGPLLSDQQFHNTGVPPRDAARPDRGRAAATAAVRSDEFNCLGPFSDARPEQCQELRFMVTDDPALEGAFKTPGLRGVADRPPYMHAGQFATLEQVVRHYVAAPHAAVGHSELTHRHAGAAPAEACRARADRAERRRDRRPGELSRHAECRADIGSGCAAAATGRRPRVDPDGARGLR